jgi:DTW domain-containing protein YfiP/GNAT superfamily N-acetyltransferase
MRSASIRRKTGRRSTGFRVAAVTIVVLGVCCIASFFETVVAFSTTNPVTNKKPAADSAPAASTKTTTPIISPNERSEILNKHLRRELLSSPAQQIKGDDIGGDIMEAALLSAKDPSSDSRYDPRFGRPALKAYRSFVYSEKHATDPLLLDGLAIKTAKHIRNMIKQTRNLADGIVSPPKNNNNDANANAPQHFREKIANSIAKGERRARERGHLKLREVCTGCSRPFNLCLCEVLNQLNNNNSSNNEATAATNASDWMVHSRVIVLQHPNEFRKKHTSTVPLLKLVLGDKKVKMKVGYEFTMKDILLSDADGDSEDGDIDNMEERPIMLFPGPDAIDLDQYVAATQTRQPTTGDDLDCNNPNNNEQGTTTNSISTSTESNEKQQPKKKKHTLVLIDGTWSEAKRIIRKSPEVLESCQMVQFSFSDDDLGPEGGTNHHQTTNPTGDDDRASWPSNPESDSDKATKSRSIYHAMRKEPEEHCLSTLEACGEALKILEGTANGPKLQDALNSVLSKHVELHLKNAREASQSRHNRDTTSRDSKLKRSKEIERSIYGGENGNDDDGADDSGDSHRRHQPSQRSSCAGASLLAIQPTTIARTPTRLLAVDSSKNTDTNVKVRRLTHEDIPVIDAWWDNGGTQKSMITITRSIDADDRLDIRANLGIVDENETLVACILRYESGPLGILHVSEEHRGKGYATALLKEATKAVSKAARSNYDRDDLPLELQCTAFIKDGNTASERVFAKVGYVRENPNVKRGTGKRQAKRKWIYPARLQTEEGKASDDTTKRT